MTMHSLTKSAIFFAVGHVAQVEGDTAHRRYPRAVSVTHPVLAVGLALGVLAIAGLPPFGVFMCEFCWCHRRLSRAQPWLAIVLVFGLLVAFGALIRRLQDVLFGEPSEPAQRVKATYVPLFLASGARADGRAVAAGPVVRWFRAVAAQLG